MTRLLGLDVETTGFDTANDRIVEMGFALWDVETKRPLVTVGTFYYEPSLEEKFTPETVAMMARVTEVAEQPAAVDTRYSDSFSVEGTS